ncbi:putative tyrosyl-DNA phosphodiesterase [Orchesella cincta]|uniref:Putative tyrosyl-DNA phosphodiesterase n=1 Tax=Orchesella cincta TaxID=48709 RepID=A0A1D2MI87_ORCCI|nr:putative tyrosyl-DNA phosphodiesterase [Orchesella cincta]
MEPNWVNPDAPAKRQRLNPPTVTSPNSRNTIRGECRYGSKCYRRNEAHLVQFRHDLLEKAYGLMKAAGDFTRLPQHFNLEDGDENAILDQAIILRDAGFETPSKTNVPEAPSSSSHSNNVPPVAKTFGSSGGGDRWKGSIGNLSDERRRKYLEQKEKIQSAVVKTRESRNEDLNQPAIKPLDSKRNVRNMAQKWESSCPFNVFLTKVRDIPVEVEGVLSASFVDLFDPSLGEVKALCHINFMVEANWFFDQTIRAGLEGKPTWLIYGEESEQLKEAPKAFPWLKPFGVKSPFPFGHHHTKMSIVQYTDSSVRFMIYTANLVESDWDNRTQGIWISPKCPKLPSGSSPSVGESPTKFRTDILQYLSTYPVKASAAWKDVIKSIDCTDIKVFLIGSVPITAQSSFDGFQFGIKKMEKILRSYEMETEPNWPLIVQCSSIGTLGTSPDNWLTSEFGSALAGKDKRILGPINLVYPTEQNVKGSFDGILGGGCLPYSALTHMKQKWLRSHFCQWKADCSGRSRAPPHIKSYSRCSPDQTKLAWFLLTSANLSKAAWGKLNKNGDRLSIMSWEAGVLFIPELLCSSKYFTVASNDANNRFPLYFDIPVTRYEKKDVPWYFEMLKLAMSADSD